MTRHVQLDGTYLITASLCKTMVRIICTNDCTESSQSNPSKSVSSVDNGKRLRPLFHLAHVRARICCHESGTTNSRLHTVVGGVLLPLTNVFTDQIDAVTPASELTKMHAVTQNAEEIIDQFLTRHPRSMTKDDDGGQNNIMHDEHTHFVFCHKLVWSTNGD